MDRRSGPIDPARLVAVALLLAFMPLTARAGKLDERLDEARAAYHELLETPDREIPEALLEGCDCIAVIPGVIKGALGYGARFGNGVVSCRDSAGAWSPPAFLRLTGGSIGFQIGAEKSDVVLFFMTERGARSLLESKFTLGGKVSVAAGPAGRSGEASTDLKLDAEIYSYARSKGLFAGLALEGARLSPDDKANARYYGKKVEAKDLLFEHRSPGLPEGAEAFLKVLP
jgi:lipid-binding SYLF domain-containing protein